ncbi:unnamed protein product [Moneuplotes crassus]|uniref:START domain-containing protein n=1 Tax=Euplotes crassus TaxID=5936 RepID=A0AAD1XER6_EUPCR|nr:unnamed protein product [Moneuplotes crassus]
MGNSSCCTKVRSRIGCLEKEPDRPFTVEERKLRHGKTKAQREYILLEGKQRLELLLESNIETQSGASEGGNSSRSIGGTLRSIKRRSARSQSRLALEQMLYTHNETVYSHINELQNESGISVNDKKPEEYDWFENMGALDSKYLNSYEEGKTIDSQYILDFYHMMKNNFETEKWEIRCDSPEAKCWSSPKGSPFTKDHLCVHIEGCIGSKYPYEMIIDAVQNTKSRLKWDKNVDSTIFLERIAKNVYIRRTKTRKIAIVSPRDVLEKKIVLKVKNNKSGSVDTYVYSSSVPDSFYKKEKGVVRATNIFFVLKITQLKDGRTKYTSYAQADPNFFFNVMPIFKALCGTKIKEWYESLIGFLDSQLESKKSEN